LTPGLKYNRRKRDRAIFQPKDGIDNRFGRGAAGLAASGWRKSAPGQASSL
jgi:hypothetical protein